MINQMIKILFRGLRKIRRLITITYWRLNGIRIGEKVNIHPSVEFDNSNGGYIEVGSGTKLDKGVIVRSCGGRVEIGKNCFINPYSILYGHGGLKIGNGVLVAANVVLIPANHVTKDVNVFIYMQGETARGIEIQDNVWLAAGSCVLDGVTVSAGTVIGAGAVVTKSTNVNGIYTGVPAKLVRYRGA